MHLHRVFWKEPRVQDCLRWVWNVTDFLMKELLAVTMPARNSSSAPKFDLKNLQDLLRYFAEVKLLLNALNVHDNQAKKDHTKHYLLVQDFEIWGAIPESSSFPLFSPFSPSLDWAWTLLPSFLQIGMLYKLMQLLWVEAKPFHLLVWTISNSTIFCTSFVLSWTLQSSVLQSILGAEASSEDYILARSSKWKKITRPVQCIRFAYYVVLSSCTHPSFLLCPSHPLAPCLFCPLTPICLITL